MAQQTNIEWTDATWNPVEGCTMAPGSEAGGCLNCYAARFALRRPASGLAVMRDSGPRWTGKVGIVEKHLADPLTWKKPKRIFVNSMSDLFHERLSAEDIARVFRVICECRGRHTFQILTKRPQGALAWFDWAKQNEPGWFDPNGLLDLWETWLGVSIEDQTTADARVPLLLQMPVRRKFISAEPLLGPVNLSPKDWATEVLSRYYRPDGSFDPEGSQPILERATWKFPNIDWVIVGGESGPGARPMDIEWARSLRDQCSRAGVSFFFKQMGGVRDKRADLDSIPEEFQIREFPAVSR
jgi:protein gp37